MFVFISENFCLVDFYTDSYVESYVRSYVDCCVVSCGNICLGFLVVLEKNPKTLFPTNGHVGVHCIAPKEQKVLGTECIGGFASAEKIPGPKAKHITRSRSDFFGRCLGQI